VKRLPKGTNSLSTCRLAWNQPSGSGTHHGSEPGETLRRQPSIESNLEGHAAGELSYYILLGASHVVDRHASSIRPPVGDSSFWSCPMHHDAVAVRWEPPWIWALHPCNIIVQSSQCPTMHTVSAVDMLPQDFDVLTDETAQPPPVTSIAEPWSYVNT
jgi:hypothetical protein